MRLQDYQTLTEIHAYVRRVLESKEVDREHALREVEEDLVALLRTIETSGRVSSTTT